MNNSRKQLIATRQIVKNILGDLNDNILTWEDLLDIEITYWGCKKVSIIKSLECLEKLCNKGEFEEIYFVPFGLEDEGVLLSSFLEQTFKEKLIAVVNRPLDLIDLRLDH